MATVADEIKKRIVTDRIFTIENLLKVQNKDRQLVPMKLLPIGRDLVTQHSQLGSRIIDVKASQVHASTSILACAILDTIFVPGTNTVIIAYEEHITQMLLAKADFAYETLQSYGIPGFPRMHHDNSYEKTFPDIQSSIYIASARSFVVGRSNMMNNLILDEFAFWPDPTKALAAIERVPMGGRVIIFSTPNGEDNKFCEMYRIAKAKKPFGDNIWTPLFHPWYMHPEFVMSPDHPQVLKADRVSPLENLDGDEMMLMSLKGVTEDQIRWRRHKIKSMEQMSISGDLGRMFKQEYPEDDESCFLATGNMYYEAELLNEKEKECYAATIHKAGADIWYAPEQGLQYVMATDPGEGKTTETVIQIWGFWMDEGQEKGKLCAEAAGLFPPEISWPMAQELGIWYGLPLWSVEANGHGIGLLREGKSYPRMYIRRDLISGMLVFAPGWLTTGTTKPFMCQELARMLPHLTIHSQKLISQIRSVRDLGIKVVSLGLNDRFMCAAIAMATRESMAVTTGYAGSAGWDW